MDQKERMLAELPYLGSDEVLSRERPPELFPGLSSFLKRQDGSF